MERLTEKTVGCFEYALKNHTPIPGEFGTYEAFFDYSMAVKKLGKYEDAEEAKAQQPMTNGDRIRAMTDEELAWELMQFRFDAYGKATGNESVLPDSQQKIAEWLKQPSEREGRIMDRCNVCSIHERGFGEVSYYALGWIVAIRKHPLKQGAYALVVDHAGEQISIPIAYCPECGAKLEGGAI